MEKILKQKKICIAVIIIFVLILAGVIIGLALNNDKDKVDKDNTKQDVIVHEADENTEEESDEDGLFESDSEDGPVLSEENIIDFNGSDAESSDEKDSVDSDKNTDSTDDKNNDKDSSDDDASSTAGNDKDNAGGDSMDDDKQEGDSKDTGAWGAFY